jgi:glycosyltransferase involved in cell wall biosynthesis
VTGRRRRWQSPAGDRPLRVAMIPLLPGDNAATRTFCQEPLEHLADSGITGRVFPPSGDRLYRLLNRPGSRARVPLSALYWYGLVLPRRVAQVAAATRFDVVFIQRGMLRAASAPVLEALVWLVAGRLAGCRILYHCDDALHTVANPRWYRARCRMADWVITGSDEVAAFARAVNPRVWRFSAPIDVGRYPVRRHQGRARTIGWVGTLPEDSLPLVTGALATVCRRHDVQVKVVSGRPFQAPELDGRLAWEQWSPARRYAVFGDLDIGIMPLADEPYQRGKEGFKLKEYMAAGLPVVCSPVGCNRQLVEDGVVGFFARSEPEWVRQLERLVGDPELRRRLGQAGRRLAETSFDHHQHLRRLGRFLRAPEGEGT